MKFFKLLPFIPIVYLQDKPRKLILQDSRFLSYEYSLSSLASVWGQTKPEDAFNIYTRNEYEIQKRLSDWKRETGGGRKPPNGNPALLSAHSA